ncbi:MAG TPA: methyltransferase domain-containing protein [Dehalococcoidia bacterium]|nr:methyltransferase domain-containing protein [Dehalococcoidia bacterium]
MSNAEDGDRPAGESVSPDVYDNRYFFASCEGYKEFRESGGRKLGARFQKALELARIRPGERVLDIGCGRGELVVRAALLGAHAVGIDYAEEAVHIAEEALVGYPPEVRDRTDVRQMNARAMDFADESFDLAFMSDVVEHLYPRELAEAVRETRRVLRPGGRLIIHTCPNRLVYEVTYPVYIRNVHRVVCRVAEIAGYQSYVIGPNLSVGREFPRSEDEHRVHVNEQTAPELARLLGESGFDVRKTEYWEIPHQLPYMSRRMMFELMLLDSVRYLRPLSFVWPLNRLFANHIWMVAERPS